MIYWSDQYHKLFSWSNCQHVWSRWLQMILTVLHGIHVIWHTCWQSYWTWKIFLTVSSFFTFFFLFFLFEKLVACDRVMNELLTILTLLVTICINKSVIFCCDISHWDHLFTAYPFLSYVRALLYSGCYWTSEFLHFGNFFCISMLLLAFLVYHKNYTNKILYFSTI